MNNLITFISATYNFLVNSWGLTLALIGFVAQKFFIPQILEYREILKRARYDVIYYANVYPFVDKDKKYINEKYLDYAHKELRVIGSRIRAHRENIPWYNVIAFTRLVPTYKNTELAATNFIAWSNDVYEARPEAQSRQISRKTIAKALGMKHY